MDRLLTIPPAPEGKQHVFTAVPPELGAKLIAYGKQPYPTGLAVARTVRELMPHAINMQKGGLFPGIAIVEIDHGRLAWKNAKTGGLGYVIGPDGGSKDQAGYHITTVPGWIVGLIEWETAIKLAEGGK